MTPHTRVHPACHGVMVTPSGHLSSDWLSPKGFNLDVICAWAKVLTIVFISFRSSLNFAYGVLLLTLHALHLCFGSRDR